MGDVDAELKILIIGDSNCGKSCLLMRFTDDTFDEHMGPTIGVDFKNKMLTLNGQQVKLTVWDTAGQDRFKTLTASYYRGAHGVILVYDVTRRATFEHIIPWLNEANVYCDDNVVKMLVANKIDEPRQVSTDEGRALAREKNMLFIECSAKTKVGVQQAFEELAQQVLDTPELYQSPSSGAGVDVSSSSSGQLNGDVCGC
ncbi:GTP-binding protein yptV3 [Salpingoeca rosetta]|uniref:GTP-binding protein yptV3 n=1 Tax=Salpingoeca rosetta (strain ATCC 50818 / BSB-021) TaxID=946362 RepID=F2TXE7_SALR5|nr:GTP-binding protein yptV3 [Salpingoeca rosetta]EGD76056.1 GTP-binding protein yptV3 [Salpingoeca rosetta]|eukprot:XP_004998231.1 GTP-binding protein yptV3 [Salpingoeca rosetta]